LFEQRLCLGLALWNGRDPILKERPFGLTGPQDPVVSQVKLIAEPWDVGQTDSYDLGRFPPLWRERNGRYRDSMRDFRRSHPAGLQEVRDPVLRVR
jgi:pullulanase/glycogen debranching enzyme